ncbi:hypothetical protein ACRCUN_13495 [Mycobacterium sp. LTG2003]
MTAYHQIFIRTKRPDQDLINDLSVAAGVEISPIQTVHNSITYGARLSNAVIEVQMQHEFDDDFGMPFSSYPILATIRDLGNDKAREEQTARSIFDKIENIGGYDLLLVFNLQRKLAHSGTA